MSTDKSLLERMAEALEECRRIEVIPGWITELLAEYRNRPPEISQETARELLTILKGIGREGNLYGKEYAVIARAEVELGGKSL